MTTPLPADYDAGVVRLHQDGSFTFTARIRYLWLDWGTVVFEVYRDKAHVDARLRGPLKDVMNLISGEQMSQGNREAPVAFGPSDSLVVPVDVVRAEGGNTNSAFRLVRELGFTLLVTSRSRKRRVFIHTVEDGRWSETDGRTACDLSNARQEAAKGEPQPSPPAPPREQENVE